ncbi:competence/damage-inducible protein A [Thermodesulfobacteriota bacterium]
MRGEIITIGDELLSGKTLDLNARYAAERLTASGLHVERITSVGDDHDALEEAINNALRNSLFIIATGGLGSTKDDITNQIVAKTIGRPLKINEKMNEKIERLAKKMGKGMTRSLEKMATMPEGSKMLDPSGNTCGYSLLLGECQLFFLPGVPEQMRYMVDKFVLPEILSKYDSLPVVKQRLLKVYGINEPEIAEIFQNVNYNSSKVLLGFYPKFPENHITIRIHGGNEYDASRELDRIESEIIGRLGHYVFAKDDKTIEGIVGGLLVSRNMTLSVAESCTGGLIGQRLTDVPGSSEYFEGGVIVYSNAAKTKLLEVKPSTLKSYGAVSEQTVEEMASGIKEKMKTSLGLAVTGIAGPSGGTKKKPVGTVCIGLASRDATISKEYRFRGSRNQIRLNASAMALDWIRRYLHGYPFISSV